MIYLLEAIAAPACLPLADNGASREARPRPPPLALPVGDSAAQTMKPPHTGQQAASDEGPSPLWLCGGGAAPGGASGGSAAASRALPPEICEAAFKRLAREDKKALRLVSRSARAFHDARVAGIIFKGARVLAGLRAALARGAAAQPPRFQRVDFVLFDSCESFESWHDQFSDVTSPAYAAAFAAALAGLRALPALKDLGFANVPCEEQALMKAMADGLPAAVPRLESLTCENSAPPVMVACFSAAARLPVLRSLVYINLRGFDDGEALLSAGDYARIAAALRVPGAFQHLKVRSWRPHRPCGCPRRTCWSLAAPVRPPPALQLTHTPPPVGAAHGNQPRRRRSARVRAPPCAGGA